MDAAKKEIETLKTSVDILKLEKREHAQSKQVKLSIVWFLIYALFECIKYIWGFVMFECCQKKSTKDIIGRREDT